VTRLAFALALLLGGLALSQPDTYFAPIIGRTPAASPVGANGLGTTIWLPDQGIDASVSLIFGTGSGSSVPFKIATQQVATVSSFPAQVDAMAAAPGVVVNGQVRTLLAILSSGNVTFGDLEGVAPQFAFVPRGPATAISVGSPAQIALSGTPGGGAALLVANGFTLSRFEIDASGAQVVVTPGASMQATPSGGSDETNALVFDGITNLGFVGGRVQGDIYRFDARLDAGLPLFFDVGLASQGRLTAPITGLALYNVPSGAYLLAANSQGVTVYDLLNPSLQSAFRVIPIDSVGPITAPAGVAVTNLAVSPTFAKGVFAVGDRTNTQLALLDWGLLTTQVDGGLRPPDTTFDPRGVVDAGPDGGVPDSGTPDGGGGGGGGGNPSNPAAGGPLGPGIPVDHGSDCSTAGGAPVPVLLLAALALLPRRRQRR